MKVVQAFFIGCCMLLAGCSLPQHSCLNMGEIEPQSVGKLYNIRIEQWDRLRFSGLLVVRKRQTGLYYAMLDASGVKLVEAEVDISGEHRLLHAKTGLKDSQLPEYLSLSLQRVYLLEPAEIPCSTTLLLQFCRERSDGDEALLLKYLQAGPFTLWEVQIGNKGDRGTITRYSQPWLGVRIYLEDFQNIE